MQFLKGWNFEASAEVVAIHLFSVVISGWLVGFDAFVLKCCGVVRIQTIIFIPAGKRQFVV